MLTNNHQQKVTQISQQSIMWSYLKHITPS